MKKYNFTDLQEEEFIKSFGHAKNITPVRIKICGNFITTRSGKSCWVTVGAAKNALKNHLSSVPCQDCFYLNLAKHFTGDIYSESQNEIWQEFLRHLQDEGILEFVVVD